MTASIKSCFDTTSYIKTCTLNTKDLKSFQKSGHSRHFTKKTGSGYGQTPYKKKVPRPGIEPGTQGFSVLRSTN